MTIHRKQTVLRRLSVLGILFSVLWLGTVARAGEGIEADMVALEQRFIPVLLLSARDDDQALAAMPALLAQWQAFKQLHAYRQPGDDGWGFFIADMEWHVLTAQRLLQAGRNGPAHQTLLEMRAAFIEQRMRHGWPFYIDRFASLVQALQGFHSGSSSKPCVALQEVDAAVDALLPQEINLYAYGLDSEREAEFRRLLQQLLDARLQLHQAVRRGDAEATNDLSEQMARLCWQMYAGFGRFPARRPPRASAA